MKVRIANLDENALRTQAVATQPRGHLLAELEEPRSQDLGLFDVAGESGLVADGLGISVGNHRAIVDAAREPPQMSRRTPEAVVEQLLGDGAQVADAVHANLREPAARYPAHPPEPRDRQRSEKCLDGVGGHDHQTIGLFQIARELGEELVRRDPHRGHQAKLAANFVLDAPRDALRVAEKTHARSDIEKRLVERQRLHQRRVTGEDFANCARHPGIPIHARADKHRVGTQALRLSLSCRHGAVHPVAPGRVVGGGDHAAPFGRAAYHHRFTHELGVVELFDRGVEGVHVDVQDHGATGADDFRWQF